MSHIIGLASMCLAVAAGWVTPMACGLRDDGSIVFDGLIANPNPTFPQAMRDRQAEVIDASTQILVAHAALRYATGQYEARA